MENPKFISVIIPVYNEERYIDGCVQSMLEQDYPKESMEWIFVDGMSKDATKQILTEYQSRYPALIRVLDNPDKTVPYAMNAGIRAAKGAYTSVWMPMRNTLRTIFPNVWNCWSAPGQTMWAA